MTKSDKYILYALGLIFLAVIAFNSFQYWQDAREKRQIEKDELSRKKTSDSLYLEVQKKKIQMDGYLAEKEAEKIKRNSYETNLRKRQQETETSSFDDDRTVVIDFLDGFKPTW